MIWPISRYHFILLILILTGIVLGAVDLPLALIPLAGLLVMWIAGPFFQSWSLFLPILTHANSPERGIAITFDDGPDPTTTLPLLDLLNRYGIKATFFVIGRKAEQCPHLIKAILTSGHDIGNHSYSHDNILMLRSKKRLQAEVSRCRDILASMGAVSHAFRPPVGITNPKLFAVLLKLGMYCVGFSCRPLDIGNRRIKNLAEKVISRIKPGDILLLHDCKPDRSFSVDEWLGEVEKIICGIEEKKLGIVPLPDLVDRPVMYHSEDPEPHEIRPIAAVFDYLAPGFDTNDHFRGKSMDERLAACFGESMDVLEIGGGTGRMTIPLSGLVKSVTAVDFSSGMNSVLTEKINRKKINNINILQKDIYSVNEKRRYDGVIAFNCLEYLNDMQEGITRISKLLKPGGLFLFTFPDASFSSLCKTGRIGIHYGLRRRRMAVKRVITLLSKLGFRSITVNRIAGERVIEVRAEKQSI